MTLNRRRGPRVTALALVLAAGAACASCATSTGEARRPAPSTSSSPAASTTGSTDALPDVESLGARRFEALPFPDWVAPGEGGVWVAGVGKGVGFFGDDATAYDRGVPVQAVCSGMDVGFGSVWVPTCDGARLSRIDPSTHRVVASIALPADYLVEESSVAAGSGRVWVLENAEQPRLFAVDPRTNRLVRRLRAPDGASALRTAFGSLWVSRYDEGDVLRLDPRTGRRTGRVVVGAGPRFMAVGPDAVWVMNQWDGSVSRIAGDGTVVATVPVSSRPIEGGDIAAAPDAVWVRTEEVLAVRIDPATNEVVQRVGPPSGSGGVAITDDAVWFSAHDVHAVWRLPTS